jgi:hypothetical protein
MKIIWHVMNTAITIMAAEHHPARVEIAAAVRKKELLPTFETAALLWPAIVAS